jgi:PhzF family phenazine biosynthesis protein
VKHISFFQVDAFTDTPFKGNPAAICLLDGKLRKSLCRKSPLKITWLKPLSFFRQKMVFSLRWFTPAVEVKLCGHATLASAHVLWEKGILPENSTARFLQKAAC